MRHHRGSLVPLAVIQHGLPDRDRVRARPRPSAIDGLTARVSRTTGRRGPARSARADTGAMMTSTRPRAPQTFCSGRRLRVSSSATMSRIDRGRAFGFVPPELRDDPR